MTHTMSSKQIVAGYLAAERPYEVCIHTTMGGYMEFCRLERGIMFEDNAKMVADEYAKGMTRTENFKGVVVRKNGVIVYEVEL